MLSNTFCAAVFAVFIAISNGVPLEFTVPRNANFRSEFDANVQELKDCGIYELVGKEFEEVYTFVESHVESLYASVEQAANDAAMMYNDFMNDFDDLLDKIDYDVPKEIGHYTQRITELTDLNEKTPQNPSKYVEMNQWTEQMKIKNRDLIETMHRTVDEFAVKIHIFDQSEVQPIEKKIPTEEQLEKKINAGITNFETMIKIAETTFNRMMKALVNRGVKAMSSNFDREAIRKVGLAKLDNLKNQIELKEQMVVRKINRMSRNMNNMYDRGMDILGSLKHKVGTLINNLHETFAVEEGFLMMSINLIERFSHATILEVSPNGKVPLGENDHIPYYGAMQSETLKKTKSSQDNVEILTTGQDKDGRDYERTFIMKSSTDSDNIIEEFQYLKSYAIGASVYVFEY